MGDFLSDGLCLVGTMPRTLCIDTLFRITSIADVLLKLLELVCISRHGCPLTSVCSSL